jgi:hypothetical protein
MVYGPWSSLSLVKTRHISGFLLLCIQPLFLYFVAPDKTSPGLLFHYPEKHFYAEEDPEENISCSRYFNRVADPGSLSIQKTDFTGC